MHVHLIGYNSEERANEVGNLVAQTLTALACELGLSLARLDGVTVAFDYARTLAELDRGFAASQPLTPTSDLAMGIAMTPSVLRDGVVKAHIVLQAGVPELLEREDSDDFSLGLYLLAHEAAHVHDLETRDRAFPGVLVNERLSGEDAYLFQAADACWDEYAACRLSARIYPGQAKHFETVFCDALNVAQVRVDQHIAAYWRDHDHSRTFAGVFTEYSNLLKYASYLLGHFHGIGSDISQSASANDALRTHGYFAPWLAQLEHSLAAMWSSRDSWPGISAYDPIKRIVKGFIRDGGIEMFTVPQGLHVRIVRAPGRLAV